jgi:hypothetical protein
VKKLGPQAGQAAVVTGLKICGTCRWWDQHTFDPGEVLLNPHNPAERHKVYACRLLPKIEYKTISEWCSYHTPV